QKLSSLRGDAAFSCRCLSAAAAAMQGQDRAAGARPALCDRSAAAAVVRSGGPAAMDGRAARGAREQADLPGDGPDGGRELGGGARQADALAGDPAGAV